MKRTTGLMLMLALCAALFSSPDVRAGQASGFAQQIQGSWTLVSIYNEWPDGRKLEQFGKNPQGFMILTPDGRFSIFLAKADLPKFAAGNRLEGTAYEYQAIARDSLAYFGRYRVASEKDGIVEFLVEGSTFPNWNGQKQKRLMSAAGKTLKVVNPAAGIGGASYLVWQRAE